jgi:hypothetical protein
MEFRNSVLDSHYPPARRKNNLLNVNLFHDVSQSLITSLDPKSPTRSSPQRETETPIQIHYRKIHQIIDSIDQHLVSKLEQHEN